MVLWCTKSRMRSNLSLHWEAFFPILSTTNLIFLVCSVISTSTFFVFYIFQIFFLFHSFVSAEWNFTAFGMVDIVKVFSFNSVWKSTIKSPACSYLCGCQLFEFGLFVWYRDLFLVKILLIIVPVQLLGAKWSWYPVWWFPSKVLWNLWFSNIRSACHMW